ncbi:MAG TPA: Xaa-Pro peptidase family protein [Gaiellaceae bacterium]|nr:Xaa-Pro peptidase family protein [Gaiellaceae bacterium]
MPDVLIYGDTTRSPELRHEIPVGVPDPFLYAEAGGVRHLAVNSMEAPRLRGLGIEVHLLDEFGLDELRASGKPFSEIQDELALRAVRTFGITHAVVPVGFPIGLADLLRANGIELTPERDLFDDRRRVKNAAELEGIRRAQAAADAGMGAARDLLRRAKANGGGALEVDGAPLTSERIKIAISQAFVEHGATGDEFIVSHGPQSAIGHEMGSGPILAGEPIVIDIWPRDNESACYADMTRSFVVGEIPAEVADWHRYVKEALDRARSELRPGVIGREVFDGTCDIFEAAGYPTQRTKEPGKPLEEGFFHGLGHGVGLEVHEEPGLGLTSRKPLVAGDVVTIEPGLYRPGFGGLRLEDLVLITEDGAENLTNFPYDLTP